MCRRQEAHLSSDPPNDPWPPRTKKGQVFQSHIANEITCVDNPRKTEAVGAPPYDGLMTVDWPDRLMAFAPAMLYTRFYLLAISVLLQTDPIGFGSTLICAPMLGIIPQPVMIRVDWLRLTPGYDWEIGWRTHIAKRL